MVMARMKELDYTPNLQAQRLAAGRSYTVALHFDSPSASFFDMFAMEFVRGIHDALHERGYGLLLSGGDESLDRWIKSGAVDGVIAVGHDHNDNATARKVAALGATCVFIGTQSWGDGSVFIDLQSGARQVAQAMWERDHRRVGFIGSPASQPVLQVFRDEMSRLGGKPGDVIIAKSGWQAEDGERAMRQLLSLKSPPTAVFARSDELAVGALRGAKKMGFEVPRDVSLVGHDDLPIARLTDPPLTTVRVNCPELGRVACETLLDLLENPNRVHEAQSVKTELVHRDTLAVARSNATKR